MGINLSSDHFKVNICKNAQVIAIFVFLRFAGSHLKSGKFEMLISCMHMPTQYLLSENVVKIYLLVHKIILLTDRNTNTWTQAKTSL